MTLRELVHRKINEAAEPIKQAILDGVPDLNGYHHLVGKYQGLQIALREIEGLLREEFIEDEEGR